MLFYSIIEHTISNIRGHVLDFTHTTCLTINKIYSEISEIRLWPYNNFLRIFFKRRTHNTRAFTQHCTDFFFLLPSTVVTRYKN